jgi:hypothetical protein
MRLLGLALLIIPFIHSIGRGDPVISNVTTAAQAKYTYDTSPSAPPPAVSGTNQGISAAEIYGKSADQTISASGAISGSALLHPTADQVTFLGSGTTNAAVPYTVPGPYAHGSGTMSISMDITLNEPSKIVFSAQSIDVVAPGGTDLNRIQTMIHWYGDLRAQSGPSQGNIWGFSYPQYETGTHPMPTSWVPSQLPAGLYKFSIDITLQAYNDFRGTIPSLASVNFAGDIAAVPLPEPAVAPSVLIAATFLGAQRRRQLRTRSFFNHG